MAELDEPLSAITAYLLEMRGDAASLLFAPEVSSQAKAALAMTLPAPGTGFDQASDDELCHVLGSFYLLRDIVRRGETKALDLDASPAVLLRPDGAQRAALIADLRGNPALWNTPGRELYLEYERTGDTEALRAGIHAFGLAAAASAGHPDHCVFLSNLGTAWRALYERTGDQVILREAVEQGRAAVKAAGSDRERSILPLINLSNTLHTRFDHTGDLEALRGSAEAARTALAAMPSDHRARVECLNNLSNALRALFRETDDSDILDEAIAIGRAAVDATPGDHHAKAIPLSNLGLMLWNRGERSGDMAPLREAVEVIRAALAAAPPGFIYRQGLLSNLSGALKSLSDRSGDIAALRDAVQASRDAVTASTAAIQRAMALSNLAHALHGLHDATGDLGALSEAIEARQAAAAGIPAGHPERASTLHSLGLDLRDRFEATGDSADLRAAVQAEREAVRATPEGHPSLAMRLSGLGSALHELGKSQREAEPLAEAASVHRAAAAATPMGHPMRAGMLSNLGHALQDLAESAGDLGMLREAVTVARTAVASLRAESMGSTVILTGCAKRMHRLAVSSGDHGTLPEARELLARATAAKSAPPSVRAEALITRALVEATSGDHAAELAAQEELVALLPTLAGRQLRRVDREHWLGQASGAGAGAAAAALLCGRPEHAVELLEQARGVMLAERMGSRSEAARLLGQAADLFDEFIRVRDLLGRLDAGKAATLGAQDADGLPANRREHREVRLREDRRLAAAQWDDVLHRIRRRPGLADFLLPPAISRLQPQAADGPIVIITTEERRCDALVVAADQRQPVQDIPLPGVTQESYFEQLDCFLAAQRAALRGRPAAQRDLNRILAWLWDVTAAPVLDSLGYTTSPLPGSAWPRLWWCPVGALAYLPFHAAGHHDDVTRGAANPRTVLDRVVSSYTATIRALSYARQSPAGQAPPKALVVAMPETPGESPLPAVDAETSAVTELLPGSLLLRGQHASGAAVLDALPSHGVAHFCCHGLSDRGSPSMSRLLLDDHQTKPFTVAAISGLHLANAELAFLSACSTSDTAPHLANEAIHITGAFQIAGYRHVIGTLWPVRDDVAVQVAVDTYRHLTSGGTAPVATAETALALHNAVRRSRAAEPSLPMWWASYIHVGP